MCVFVSHCLPPVFGQGAATAPDETQQLFSDIEKDLNLIQNSIDSLKQNLPQADTELQASERLLQNAETARRQQTVLFNESATDFYNWKTLSDELRKQQTTTIIICGVAVTITVAAAVTAAVVIAINK